MNKEIRAGRFFFKRQLLHFVALLVLVPIGWLFAAGVLGDGAWLGIQDVTWFWLATGNAILHQTLTWLVWRGQLEWSVLSNVFGRADLFVWGVLFFPLLVARPLLIFGLAMADGGSMALPLWISKVLGIVALVPSVYTLWSVAYYFGFSRAMGGDHFRSKYREMPFVKKGAFTWSNNAMYSFGFLGLWSIALLLESQAALSVALFQHAYIWIHHYCTEEPDMELIYGRKRRLLAFRAYF